MNQLSPYTSSKTRDDASLYPDAFRYFRLDNYVDLSTGLLHKIPSAKKGSHAARANDALGRIQGRTGVLPYLSNRLREMVSVFVFSVIMQTKKAELSSVINDILFHTDAIATIDNTEFAIDFTENFDAIDSKISHLGEYGKGHISLIDSNNISVFLPFLVAYIAPDIIDQLLIEIDSVVRKNPKTPKNEIALLVQDRLAGFIQRDKLPRLLFQIHANPAFPDCDALQKKCVEGINNIMQIPPLQDLGLKGRPLLCLKNMGFKTISYLGTRTPQELMSDPNLGRQSLEKIQQALADRGLSLTKAPQHEYNPIPYER